MSATEPERFETIPELLRWAMPRLGLDPRGYRNVRRTVIRRVARRMSTLGLARPDDYRRHLEAHDDEWHELDVMCRIPISRFWRDAAVFELLARELLPERAAAARAEGREAVRVWSAGCASGEEPRSVALAWGVAAAASALPLEIVATDASPEAIARAERAEYTESSFSELPPELRARPWPPDVRLRFVVQDLRVAAPEGRFDVVLCRNLAFTYFDARARGDAARRLSGALVPQGVLVVGRGEELDGDEACGLGLRRRAPLVYERA